MRPLRQHSYLRLLDIHYFPGRQAPDLQLSRFRRQHRPCFRRRLALADCYERQDGQPGLKNSLSVNFAIDSLLNLTIYWFTREHTLMNGHIHAIFVGKHLEDRITSETTGNYTFCISYFKTINFISYLALTCFIFCILCKRVQQGN